MPNPFKWLWERISGNFLWWAICGLGALTVSSLGAFRQSVSGVPFDAYLWAAVFVVSATLFYLCVDKLKANLNPESEPIKTGEPLIPDKLNIEILKGYVGWSRKEELYEFLELWVLLSIRVAPNSPPGVRVKKWSVEFNKLHSGYWTEAALVDIPLGLTYTAKGTYDIDVPPVVVGASLSNATYNAPVAYGEHTEGFLLARVYLDNAHELFRCSFKVTAIDALDGWSIGEQIPGEWLHPATFSIVEPPPLSYGYLSPPAEFK
jgi:hypothetical protein